MIGRGVRNHPGKKECVILDFVDNVGPRTRLASTPTLFGLSPDFSFTDTSALNLQDKLKKVSDNTALKAKSVVELERLHTLALQSPAEVSFECQFKEFDSPLEPLSIKEDQKLINSLSGYCWYRIGPLTFVCILTEKRELFIEKQGGTHIVCIN